MGTITHAVVATGVNNPSKQVSKDAWNDGHVIDLDISDINGLSTALDGKVDTSTTVNGHELTGDIIITYGDVGALANVATGANGLALSGMGTSDASGVYGVAIGFAAVASGTYSVSVGGESSASGAYSVSVGYAAVCSEDEAVALGHGSLGDVTNAVSVGSAGSERRIVHLADGINPTDAATVGQLPSPGASPPFDDATALVKGSVDATKLFRFEVDGLSAGTTRVATVPDADFTMAGLQIAQDFTVLQTFSAGAQIATGQTLSWNADAFLYRRGAASIQHGAADAASPVAQTVGFQGSRGGTDSNTAGVDASIVGSLGTGTAASGKLLFKVGQQAASGSTQHTAVTALTIQYNTGNNAQVLATDGGLNAPGLSLAGLPSSGWSNGGGVFQFSISGSLQYYWNSGETRWRQNYAHNFMASGGSIGGSVNAAYAHAGSNAFIYAGSASPTPGTAISRLEINKEVTAIADATATTVFTVTVPNASHSAVIEVNLAGKIGAGGAIGAGEATGNISYQIAIARTAGVNAVAGISAAYGSTTAAVAGATTITVAATLGAVAGAVGASNTFTIQVTITKGGGASANHTCLAYARVMNSNATGVSIA